jgi:hypothetical protein
VRSQVGIVVAPSRGRLEANAARVRLVPGVHLKMVGEVVASRKPLVAVRTGVVPRARVLRHVPLPVGLVGKLQAALVADEGFDAAVRAHVGVKQRLPQVGLAAELALKRPRPDALMLPHVVVQVALGHERVLAHLALICLLLLVLDSNVLVDARFVGHLVADGAGGVQRALFVLGHKILLMAQPDVAREAGAVNKDLAAVGALFRLLLVLALLVPVEVALSLKHLAAVAEELLGRLLRPVFHVDALVLGQVAVPLERLATDVARERRLARVHANMLAQLVGRVEPLLTVAALKGADLKVAAAVVAQQARLGKLFAALQALVRLVLVVAGHVLGQQNLLAKGAVAHFADKLSVLVGKEVFESLGLGRDSPIVKHYSSIKNSFLLLVSTLPYVVKVKNYS